MYENYTIHAAEVYDQPRTARVLPTEQPEGDGRLQMANRVLLAEMC